MILKTFLIVILSTFSLQSEFCQAALTAKDQREQEQQAKIDELYSACTQQKKKDKLCDSLIIARQIGDDSVEYIKEYMQLSPVGYAMLTFANMLATGRFRIKTASFFNKKAQHTYDYQAKNQTWMFIYEQRF